METQIYNTKGKTAGNITLNEKVWGLRWNANLVHQVVESMRSLSHLPTASVKDRGNVSGGGKKPWRQKGTGRARHGSSRSPIWRHGGVTHGPLVDKNYIKKINKKVRVKALHTILSEKLRKNEVLFVDSITMKEAKTREAKTIFLALSGVKGFEKMFSKKRNAAYFASSERSELVERSFANFSNIVFDMVQNMNPIDLLTNKFLVIINPEKSLDFIDGKINKSINQKSKVKI